jgi:glycosyltransferase involved in cell wall biosynthesis
MPKVAIVYPHIALYRRAVFKQLCQSDEIDFAIYADNKTHQDSLAIVTANGEGSAASDLLSAKVVQTENIWFLNRLLWQWRVVKDVFADRFDAYIFLGSIHFISTWVAALAARLRGRPVLYWTIGVQRDEHGLKRGVRRFFNKIPHRLLLYGPWAQKILMTWGFKEEALWIIYNSLDQETTGALYQRLQDGELTNPMAGLAGDDLEAGPPAYFVCLGRLIPKKRFDLAIAAMALLRDAGREARLVIIGGGGEEVRLRAMIADLGLEDLVTLLGPSHEEAVLGPWLYHALACVMPGQVGLSSVHAHSYGTAVISHDNWDQHSPEFEIVEPGLSGLIFEDQSAPSLAAAMGRILDGELDPQACKAHARGRIEQDYNPVVQAKRIVEAVQDCLQGRAGSG